MGCASSCCPWEHPPACAVCAGTDTWGACLPCWRGQTQGGGPTKPDKRGGLAQARVQTELQEAILRGRSALLHDDALPAQVRQLHERQTALTAQLQASPHELAQAEQPLRPRQASRPPTYAALKEPCRCHAGWCPLPPHSSCAEAGQAAPEPRQG